MREQGRLGLGHGEEIATLNTKITLLVSKIRTLEQDFMGKPIDAYLWQSLTPAELAERRQRIRELREDLQEAIARRSELLQGSK